MSEVVTVTLAEEAATEEAACEAIVDQGFVPSAPLTAQPAAYHAETSYAKGAYATEGGKVYRSQAAGNEGHTPSEDADFAHWAPVCIALVPLQNPSYGATPTLKQQAHNNKPPASSAATATPAETIGVGAETPV